LINVTSGTKEVLLAPSQGGSLLLAFSGFHPGLRSSCPFGAWDRQKEPENRAKMIKLEGDAVQSVRASTTPLPAVYVIDTTAIPTQIIVIPKTSRKFSFSLKKIAAASATKIGSKASNG
jgi:hypothetical protein